MGNFSMKSACVFIMLQTAAIISMMDLEFKIVKPTCRFCQKPEAVVRLNFDTHEVLQSPLYSLCALSLIFYGYGVVYLRTDAPSEGFVLRLCSASVLLWRKLSPIMILPWLMMVGKGIWPYPERLWNCIFMEYEGEINNFYCMAFAAISFWIISMFVVIWTFLMVIKTNQRLIFSTRLETNATSELRAYIQAINESFGFELVVIDT
ncbi:uncharacterized protein LOC117901355 [Drosophila subobscura]|uniref:uncharacterized protein LOC117901355 n=1 Tax=Drosophila subobscura TaxID=7241 RepID=UPI00155A1B47|nr:uncharacterized protein LOC117901355 [Drosophila subobscura]